MTVLGIGFIVLWLAACLVWAVLSFPGGLMANASGSFSPRAHMWMLAGLLLGQLVAAAAGIPAGLAFFHEETRSSLLWTFGWLLGGGIAIQAIAVVGFFNFGHK